MDLVSVAANPLPQTGFAAFLFDMDGTILSSILATERVWSWWMRSHGLDVAAVLPTIHGQRAIDTMRRLAVPGLDPEAEARLLLQREMEDVDGIEAIRGAGAFLASLPPDRWAVVTSAPKALALKRIAAAGLSVPPVMVTAEDVSRGKPAPDCFLLGAERLGVAADACLVFEDAPAGIAAAEAAGASVMVVTATHEHRYGASHAAIENYESIAVTTDAAGALRVLARA